MLMVRSRLGMMQCHNAKQNDHNDMRLWIDLGCRSNVKHLPPTAMLFI